jgi:hypothetical protein
MFFFIDLMLQIRKLQEDGEKEGNEAAGDYHDKEMEEVV